MRRFDTPYMADWFAISLRWIMLVGLVVSLGLAQRTRHRSHVAPGDYDPMEPCDDRAGEFEHPHHFSPPHQHFVDLILAGTFFWVQGGLRGPCILGRSAADPDRFDLF
jgi:hypothetical protein